MHCSPPMNRKGFLLPVIPGMGIGPFQRCWTWGKSAQGKTRCKVEVMEIGLSHWDRVLGLVKGILHGRLRLMPKVLQHCWPLGEMNRMNPQLVTLMLETPGLPLGLMMKRILQQLSH